jgi:transposase
MPQHHSHNTRLTPEKRPHGGARPGAGRPDKENQNPNSLANLSSANQQRVDDKKQQTDYELQQQQLGNHPGRSWSYHECTLLLTLVIGIILHYNETPTQALRTVSTLLRRSYMSLHALWSRWRDEKEVYVVDTSGRGGGASTHINHSHHVSVEVVFTIIECIREANITGGGCTTTTLVDAILKEHDITMHPRTLRNVLASMGYLYGKANVIGKMNDAWYVARIRTFLIQYSKALIDQQEGRCIIVYTDESYVNANHARKSTWYSPLSSEKNDVVRPSGKGKRLVLLHAFTKDGWLAFDRSIHNDRADQLSFSCELIYEAEKGDGDYHDNMNGSIYMQWLKNRLMVACNKLYPRRKMVLVLDNASYHHVRGPDWINVHLMKKDEIAYKLVELGVTSITVERQKKGTESRETKRFNQPSFYQRGGRFAPTLEELRAELSKYLTEHPSINRTEVSKLFEENGHQLLYTPPYLPGVQPIERLWAYVKNYVASQYQTGRTMPQLLEQTYKGFYGDDQGHEGVTKDLAGSVIRHSIGYCDYLISQDDSLDGTMYDLQTELTAAPTDIVQDIEADMDPFPGVVEEEQ